MLLGLAAAAPIVLLWIGLRTEKDEHRKFVEAALPHAGSSRGQLSGFGEEGPYRDRPGQDLLLQAMSGALFSTGHESDPPSPAPMYVVDAVSAYTAFEDVLAALLHRERTGDGQRVDVNMLDAITCLQMQELSIFTVGDVPQRRSNEPHGHTYIRAPYGVFATSDSYLALAFPPLAVLGRILEVPELLEMDEEVEGWSKRDHILRWTRERLARRTTRERLEAFAAHKVWAGPVYGYADLVDDPQVKQNGTFITYDHPTEGSVTTPGFPIRFHETPSTVRRGAPLAGEHTREVLLELGIAEPRIDALVADGVVASTAI